MFEAIGTIMMIIVAIPLALLCLIICGYLIVAVTFPLWGPFWGLGKLIEWWANHVD